MENKFYFLKLNPCRPSFAQDMTDIERAIMGQHVLYWKDLMNKKIVKLFGPVFDPAGAYGIGIVETSGPDKVEELIKNDPAATINTYEWFAMRATLPETISDGEKLQK